MMLSFDRIYTSACILAILATAMSYCLVPVVYDSIHLRDTLYLATIGLRALNGIKPVLEYSNFYGSVTSNYIAFALAFSGISLKALDYAVILQFATIALFASAVTFHRTGSVASISLFLVIAGCLLARAPLEEEPVLTNIISAHSFVYNRFATALTCVCAFFLVIPTNDRKAELFASVLCGLAATAAALTKPTFIVLGLILITALIVGRRWQSLAVCLTSMLISFAILDPFGYQLWGGFQYGLVATSGIGSNPDLFGSLFGKVVRLILQHQMALIFFATVLFLPFIENHQKPWTSVAVAIITFGGFLAMAVTMGTLGLVGHVLLPILATLSIATFEHSRQRRLTKLNIIKTVSIILVVAFALPQLINSIMADFIATTRKNLVLFDSGPLAGYLARSREFRDEFGHTISKPTDPARQVEITLAHLLADKPMNAGIEYIMLFDGVSTLQKIDNVAKLGIVSDNGVTFEFALQSQPTLNFPVWASTMSPELAQDKPMPQGVDLVMLQRPRITPLGALLINKMQNNFMLCQRSLLWDVYVRNDIITNGCDVSHIN